MFLVVGASGLGAVFAFGVGTKVVDETEPSPITDGMQLTFMLSGVLMVVAIWVIHIDRQANS